jgi:hypothetical protein
LSDKIPPAAFEDCLGSHSDYRRETPASDELFQVYKSMYAYDKTRLNARISATEESAGAIHQTITFDAAASRAHLEDPSDQAHHESTGYGDEHARGPGPPRGPIPRPVRRSSG